MPGHLSRYLKAREGDRIPGGWDGIRTGSEFCPRLLPSTRSLEALSRQRDPSTLSLVTPVAGPDEIRDVMGSVRKALDGGWGEIVVNDWGVLSELGPTEGVVITAGRLLMRFRRGPGVFDPWDELDLEARRYFAWGPLYDSPFLAFLEDQGVSRIELDPPRHWLALPDLEGFKFSLHADTRLISVTAACPWLYDEDRGTWNLAAACGRVCTGQGDILMSSHALEGSLLLRGKAILEPVEIDPDELDLTDHVDRIIYDRIA